MALFKILRGSSKDLNSVAFHDGHAYFTQDDGKFYIDSEINGEQKRTQINKVSSSVQATLTASAWASKKQTVQISGMKATSEGIIGVAQTISSSALTAAKNAEMYIESQANGSITIAAAGDTPSVDIPVVVTILN